ncbi:MAG: hypothetical protein ABFE16_03755 [Armatimonadia bacterium]
MVLLVALLAAADGLALGQQAQSPVQTPPTTRTKEVSLLGGWMQDVDEHEASASWELQYMQSVGDHEAVSFGWLNEGHVDNHRRDGHSVQFWLRTKTLDDRLTLGMGLGPYRYFDTTIKAGDSSYSDDHGWGAIYSLDAAWQMNDRWVAHLRSNFLWAQSSINTRTLNLGFGYLLSADSNPPSTRGTEPETQARREEMNLLGGRTIVNSFSAEKSMAGYLDYRRSFARYLDWSVGLLNEGDPRLIRRNGLVTQVWAVRRFPADSCSLGLGVGTYWAADSRRSSASGGDAPFLSGVITMSAARWLSPKWQVRASWNRIVTGYDRDTDVLLLGFGHSLGGTRFY